MSDPKVDSKKESLLDRIFDLLEKMDQWVRENVGDNDTRRAVFMDLGVPPDLPDGRPPAKYPASNLPGITKYRATSDPDDVAILEALKDAQTIYEAARSVLKPFIDSDPDAPTEAVEELAHRFFELMTLNYLRLHVPILYWLGQPLGLIEEKLTTYEPGKTYPDRLTRFFKDIGKHFAQVGGGLDTQAEAEAWMDLLNLSVPITLLVAKLIDHFSHTRLVDGLKELDFYQGWDPESQSQPSAIDQVLSRTVSFAYDKYNTNFVLIPREHGGPGFLLALGGEFDLPPIPLWGNKALQISLDAQAAVDMFVRLDHFKAIPDAHLPKLNFKLVTLEADTADPSEAEISWVIGAEKGTHLELGPMTFEVELSTEGIGISVAFADSAIVIKDGDSFLIEAIGTKESRLAFDFGLGFKSGGNIFLEGGMDAGLKLIIPVSKSLGFARLQYLSIALEPEISDSKNVLKLETTAALDVKLGPIKASIDQIGFRLALDFKAANKNLGFADLSFGFKPPNGIGLVVDAKAVKGGGFLYLDPPKGQYAGVMQLEISGLVAVKAIGLLNTKMPDGSKGYSLLIIITAEGFKPIPLGFGFNLTGIGGLVGIHRTANTKALQDGVRNHALDAILFPKDPVRNAPQYLSILSTVFPPARDSYLLGLVLQITWGTPKLITINLALVVEFGAKSKFIVMGQLFALLPDENNDLIRLKMDALGILDFDEQTASLDARLFDSRLSKVFVISGDMAMRMKWGDQPSFALAVGGFHPAFVPPAGFPKLERVSMGLVDREDLKVRCEAYLAITSNTLQFGAKFFLFAKKFKFSIEGHLGIDVLIMSDWHFLADFTFSAQLKRGSTNLFKVTVEGEIAYTGPWRIRGKASFEIFWVDFSVSFDRTFGGGEKPLPPAPLDIAPILKKALNDPVNWNAALPPATTRLVTFRESAKPGELLVHPLGKLSVKQNVVPLNLRVTRFGNARPSGEQEFRLAKVMLGGRVGVMQPEPVRDFFAPSQFRDMSDDEKLSSPAFEKLAAGVQFGAAAITHGTAQMADLSFEEILMAPKQPEPIKTQQPFPVDILTRFGHLSAVGKNEVRRSGQNKYQVKTLAVALPVRSYGINTIKDAPNVVAREFPTWIEAKAAIWQARKDNAIQARELQIVALPKVRKNA